MPVQNRRRFLQSAGLVAASGALCATAGTVTAEGNEQADTRPPLLPDADAAEHWASFRGSPGNTARVANGPDIDVETLEVGWEYEHDGDDRSRTRHAIADDTVYLATDAEVQALDAGTGSLEWESGTIGAAGTPTIAYGTVYVGGERLTALDAADGTTRWQVDLGTVVETPTVAYETVYVVADGTLYAFDVGDGSLRWRRDSVRTTGPRDSEGDDRSLQQTPVAVTDETVYAVTDADERGGVVALDPLTGDTRRTYEYGNGGHTGVVATENYVFAEFGWEEAHAIDVETGEVVTARGIRPIAVAENLLITVTRYEIVATDLETGEERWSYGPYSHVIGPATIVDGTVYACVGDEGPHRDDDDVLLALAAEDGQLSGTYSLHDFETGEDTPGSEVVVSDGTVYLTTQGGTLVALRTTDGDDTRGDTEDEGDTDDGDEARRSVDSAEGGSGENDPERVDDADQLDRDPDENELEWVDENDGTDTAKAAVDAEQSAGFSAGVAISGGTVVLEWLRRRVR